MIEPFWQEHHLLVTPLAPSSDLSRRRVIGFFVLLPLVCVFQAGAHTAVRTNWVRYLDQSGVVAQEIQRILGYWMVLTLVAVILGAVLAIVAGPRRALVIGTFFALLGYTGLAATEASGSGMWLALSLVALGQGFVTPAAYAAAAVELPTHESLRAALFVSLYAASNVPILLPLGLLFVSVPGASYFGPRRSGS